MSTSTNVQEFTVSELAGAIKKSLEAGFAHVRLRGEISGFKGAHSSGHCYFALKDDKARIEAVIWRGVLSRLPVKPQEGLEVVVEGRLSTFPGSSKYQIVIEHLTPAGVGALMALLEERKRKLAALGLFDPSRKKPLPFLPSVIGIITSPTGAVIRDMLHGFAERFPTRVLVWPTRVQGETCATEVAAAIRGFNALPLGGPIPRPELLIVARGGGSLEDLWGFNEEVVVRAAADSAIPLISAVGHETDWSLLDLVADARAPTPTKAAEWAVPKYSELSDQTIQFGLRLSGAVRRVFEGLRAHWRAAERGLPRAIDLTALPRQRFDTAERRLGRALLANTRTHGLRNARIATRLHPRLLAETCGRGGNRLETLARRCAEALRRGTATRRTRFARLAGRHAPRLASFRIARASETLEGLANRADRALRQHVAAHRHRLFGVTQLLASLGYRNVLRRGYALVRARDGRMIRHVADIHKGDQLDIELCDGRAAATADYDGNPSAEPEASSEASRKPRGRSRGPGQGSLF